MKKILLLACSCLMTFCMKAVETTDYIAITAATVNPGGDEVKLTFSLVGSTNYYSGYNMDIWFPEGMEVCMNKSNKPNVVLKKPSLYPYDEEEDEETGDFVKTYTHTISSSYGVVGDRVLRVACISTVNGVFTKVGGDLFTVTVKASPFAKPGNASIKIDGVALKVAGGAEYDPEERFDENVTISTSATAALTISSTNKWSTCILPFATELPEGVSAYSTSSKTTIEGDDYLILSEESELKGYTPYILYSESGYSNSLSGTVDATDYPAEGYVTEGYLNGAITVQQITDGFVLQNLSEGMKFYATAGKTFSIPAGKCWVTLPSAAVKAFGFAIEDETGVKAIRDVQPHKNEVYDLSGQKIDISQTRPNNIYIINGQKVLKTK